MKLNLGFLKNILRVYASKIDISKIKSKNAVLLWKTIVQFSETMDNELKPLGSDIGKMLAFRYDNDKEFKEKVDKLIEEIKNAKWE